MPIKVNANKSVKFDIKILSSAAEKSS